MLNTNEVNIEERTRTKDSGQGRRGEKYFFVQRDGEVIAGNTRESIEAYVNDPSNVQLGEPYNGWRWIQQVHVPLREQTVKAVDDVVGRSTKQGRLLEFKNKLLNLVQELDTFILEL